MSPTFENSPLITPTLQHFGVLTSHLERMIDWYAKVALQILTLMVRIQYPDILQSISVEPITAV